MRINQQGTNESESINICLLLQFLSLSSVKFDKKRETQKQNHCKWKYNNENSQVSVNSIR
jgi:hypothetical protein